MIKVYESGTTDFTSNGLGIIQPIKCIETKKASLNGWEIDCEVPLKYKDMISKDNIVLVKTKEKGEQPFIIEAPTITNVISFKARHVLFLSERYILDDVRPTNQTALNFLLYINERTDNVSPFSFNTYIKDVKTKYFIRKTLLEALEETEQLFNSSFDANWFDITMLETLEHESDIKLIYKKNIEGIQIYENWDTVCTKIMPVGPDGLILDEKYLYADIEYPQPYTRIVDFSINAQDENENEKTDDQLKEELKILARKYLDDNKYPKINYTVSSNIIQNIEIGSIAKVLHPLANIEVSVQSYQYNVLTKRIVQIEFGNYVRDVKKEFAKIAAEIKDAKTTSNNILKKAQEDAKKIMDEFATRGHKFETENETYYLDVLPKEKAKYVMRQNLGGIAFSTNGLAGPYTTAWTIDGKFNAEFITSGTLRGIKIICESGYIGGLEVDGKILKFTAPSRVQLPSGPVKNGTMHFAINADGSMGSNIFTFDIVVDGRTYASGYLDPDQFYCQNINGGSIATPHCSVSDFLYAKSATIDSLNTSSVAHKKSFIKKCNNIGLNEVMKTDVYSYRLKHENVRGAVNVPKHFGFVIGDGYSISEEILGRDKDAIDLYSALALAYKAIQEQQEKINNLEQKMEGVLYPNENKD